MKLKKKELSTFTSPRVKSSWFAARTFRTVRVLADVQNYLYYIVKKYLKMQLKYLYF